MPESLLHLDIVYALIVVIFGHYFCMYRGYILTVVISRNYVQWLYLVSGYT